MTQPDKFKIGVYRDGEKQHIPYAYSNTWELEPTTGPDRLVVAPASGHVDLMLNLARGWEDYYLLYVLLVPRTARDPGRYESPWPLEYFQVQEFCTEFMDFLENDGRHHLWIGSTDDSNLLVYDQHNIIYAYGNVEKYLDELNDRGFKSGEVDFPAPHVHHYHVMNDSVEEDLFSYWSWEYYGLEEEDEY